MPTPPPLPQPTSSDWWGRNWKWFVPLLCLVLALLAAGVVGFVALLLGFLKSSDPYQGAVARARAEPALVEALGGPITEGFFTTGSINLNGPSGAAELSIPLEGPAGKATLYVEATRKLGVWHYDGLVAEIAATRRRIDLSDPKPTAAR